MEFTEQRAAVLLELHTMIKAYRVMQDLVDTGKASMIFSEACEQLGFAAIAFRSDYMITAEEEKQFSKAIKRGEYGNH